MQLGPIFPGDAMKGFYNLWVELFTGPLVQFLRRCFVRLAFSFHPTPPATVCTSSVLVTTTLHPPPDPYCPPPLHHHVPDSQTCALPPPIPPFASHAHPLPTGSRGGRLPPHAVFTPPLHRSASTP